MLAVGSKFEGDEVVGWTMGLMDKGSRATQIAKRDWILCVFFL